MPKISKNRIKQLTTFKQKKIRDQEKIFIAEGEKIVSEILISKLQVISIVATKEWIELNSRQCKESIEILEVNPEELKRISCLTTPNKVVAFTRIPELLFDIKKLDKKLTLVLDEIQDPGNLGTIIRLADWFGIEYILCSQNTVDLYNPKVIQSTMGSFLRVNVIYLKLDEFLIKIKHQLNLPVFGTFLEGKSIYTANLPSYGLIVMGNESKGISESIESIIDEKITIPSFNLKPNKIDSLNVSVATAIICSEFRRNNQK
jgi:RNA methyltransferase, TrmH family